MTNKAKTTTRVEAKVAWAWNLDKPSKLCCVLDLFSKKEELLSVS